jgi:hypothetical protein
MGDGVDGVLLDDAAAADWLAKLASSQRGTLQGCLRPAVFFLIFVMTLENGGYRFNLSRLD